MVSRVKAQFALVSALLTFAVAESGCVAFNSSGQTTSPIRQVTAAFLTNDRDLPTPVSAIPWGRYDLVVDCCIEAGPRGVLSPGWLDKESIATKLLLAHAAGAKLTVSIAGGGPKWAESASPAYIGRFAGNLVRYVEDHGFDGLDLDWESSADVPQYAELIRRLRAAMPDKLLTMDAYDSRELLEVARISFRALNYINVMCYDMGGYYETSWHNSALLGDGSGRDNCDSRTAAFIGRGVPASALVAGIPAYGYVWAGCAGPFEQGCSQLPMQLPYSRIMADPTWNNGGVNARWDPVHKADYFSVENAKPRRFVSFTGARSIGEIVKWGRSRGVGGYYLLFLNQEYTPQQSGDAAFPLSSALYRELRLSAAGLHSPMPEGRGRGK